MTHTNVQINGRQLMYLILAFVSVYKIIDIPSIMVEASGRDAWMAIIGMLLIDAAVLTFFFLALKFAPEKTFYDITRASIGKVGAKILVVIFLIYTTLKLYFNLNEIERFLMINLYDNITWIPLGLCMVLLMSYAAYKSLRGIGRAAEFMGPFIFVGVLLSCLFILTETKFENLLPMLEKGIAPVFKGLDQYMMGSGDTVFLLFFLGRIKIEKTTGGRIALGMALGAVIALFFNISFYAFYDYVSVHQYGGHALSDMVQYARGSDSFARVDIIVILSVMSVCLVKLMALAWCFLKGMQFLFDASDKPKTKIFCLLPMVFLLTGVEILLRNDAFIAFIVFTSSYKYIIFGPVMLIGVLAPIFAAISAKKDRKKGGGDKKPEDGAAIKKPKKKTAKTSEGG